MSYRPEQTLGYGHTLDLVIYSGVRNPKRVFAGKVLVDESGFVDFGKNGRAKVGGLKAAQACNMIATTIRNSRQAGTVTVHLKGVEDTPLVTVTGAVANPGVAPWFEGEGIGHVLSYVGGREPGSKGQAFYVIRNGVRHFYGSPASAAGMGSLEAGDIVEFSHDL